LSGEVGAAGTALGKREVFAEYFRVAGGFFMAIFSATRNFRWIPRCWNSCGRGTAFGRDPWHAQPGPRATGVNPNERS